MIARKIRAYVEIPISPFDEEHSVRYAMAVMNISLSGCFIKMDQALEVGTPISFSMALQDGKKLELRGTVAREQSEPHGYGISFGEISDEERRELALLIAESNEPLTAS